MDVAQFLESANVNTRDISLLPLCHTTGSEAMIQILRSGTLRSKKENEPFEDECLVFMFYGKAQYVNKKKVKDSFDPGFLPGTLIFDFKQVVNFCEPVRMIPLDSGGYRLYGLSRETIRNEFGVNQKIESSLRKFIKLAFINNVNYLNSKMVTEDDIDCTECAAFKKYVNLFKRISKRRVRYGHQAFTVELHFNKDLTEIRPKYIVSDLASLSSNGTIREVGKSVEQALPYNKSEDGPKTNMEKIGMMRSAVRELMIPRKRKSQPRNN